MSDLLQFMMIWLACVFPFGVYATVAVSTGRMPQKVPAVFVALGAFTSPFWAGWPAFVFWQQGILALAALVILTSGAIGFMLGIGCRQISVGLKSFAISGVLFGTGVALHQWTSWEWVPMIVAVGLWHFSMGGLLMMWLWSDRAEEEIDREPLCFACGYDMQGLDHGKCPECGHQHDLEAESDSLTQPG